jgi:hypothetical protein
MEYTEKFTEQHFIQFKEQFLLLAQEQFQACKGFMEEVHNANSLIDFKQVLYNYADDIFEKLGGEYDTDEYENTIYYLECDIDRLETQLDNLKFGDETIHDDMKFEVFREYASKYTPWELEELLKNGKL